MDMGHLNQCQWLPVLLLTIFSLILRSEQCFTSSRVVPNNSKHEVDRLSNISLNLSQRITLLEGLGIENLKAVNKNFAAAVKRWRDLAFQLGIVGSGFGSVTNIQLEIIGGSPSSASFMDDWFSRGFVNGMNTRPEILTSNSDPNVRDSYASLVNIRVISVKSLDTEQKAVVVRMNRRNATSAVFQGKLEEGAEENVLLTGIDDCLFSPGVLLRGTLLFIMGPADTDYWMIFGSESLAKDGNKIATTHQCNTSEEGGSTWFIVRIATSTAPVHIDISQLDCGNRFLFIREFP